MPFSKAAVFHGSGVPLTFEDVPIPPLRQGEILIRGRCCTLCGSDLHTYTGRRSTPTPTVLGHEILGQIEAFGSDAPRTDALGQRLQEGDRVTWSLTASCGKCFFCDREIPQKCERLFKYGHERLTPERPLSGGLAEYCILTEGTAILRLADELSDCVACPANCATATVAAALRTAGGCQGQAVLVQGAGALGVTACALARAQGAREVICCDIDERRLERARLFGATQSVHATGLTVAVADVTGGRGVDVVLELSGSPDAVEAGVAQVRTGGTCVLVGTVFPTRPVSLLPEAIVRRLITIRGVHNYTPGDLVTAVRFLTEHQNEYPFEQLVIAERPLAAAEEAFGLALANPGSRVAVVACDSR